MLHRLALIAALAAGPAAADMVARTSVLVWNEGYESFGSFSGLAVDDAGERFVVVSDKGFYARGVLARSQRGLSDVTLADRGPLLRVDGTPVGRFDIDAEGITRLPDGRLAVSFEANHRIRIYSDISKPPRAVPNHPAFSKLQNNSGMEALFSDGDGALYAIPERSGRLERPFPVYRFAKGWTVPMTLRREPPHLVAGAEIGPDGKLYVLERDLRTLGFASRIRRFDITADGLVNEELVMESRMGQYDNLEGIALWRDGAGQIRILCISDDNNKFFQRTEFVEFTLKPRFSDGNAVN